MKKYISFWSLSLVCLLACLLSACSTSRSYTYGYPQVRQALMERFYKYQWSPNATEYAAFSEPSAGTKLKIVYYDWQFPSTKLRMEMTLERIDQNNCEFSVFVKDHHSWWQPFGYYTSMQHNIADALLRRMQTGKWDALGYESVRMMQPLTTNANTSTTRAVNPPPFQRSPAGASAPAFGASTSTPNESTTVPFTDHGISNPDEPPLFIE